jgi:methionine synthase II (cobalamin-independent)
MKLKQLNEVHFDPVIQIEGIGRYKLSQAIDNVRGKLEDLLQRATGPVSLENWQRINLLLEKQTLQSFVSSIAEALKQIQ